MSNAALTWAWDVPGLNLLEQCVLVCLADRANTEHQCWPSMEDIALRCRVTPRAAIRAVKGLETKEVLEVSRSHRKVNLYTLRVNDVHASKVCVTDVHPTDRVRVNQGHAKKVRVNDVHAQGEPGSPNRVNDVHPNPNRKPKRNLISSKTSASGKKLWEPPAWWTPLMTLNGYVAKDYSKRAQGVSEACKAHQVEPAKVITGFAYDWPTLKIRYGWDNPVAVLQGKPLQIAIEKAKGQQPWLLGGSNGISGRHPEADNTLSVADQWNARLPSRERQAEIRAMRGLPRQGAPESGTSSGSP